LLGDAYWLSVPDGQLRLRTFQNPRWQTSAILKIRKTVINIISATVHAINTKFGTLMHIGPANRFRSQDFQLLKIQDGGCHHIKKLKNGHDSATVRPIGTKFGLIMHIGPPNRTGG